MAKRYLIGIDCGTTNVKALIYSASGEELFCVSRKNEVLTDGVCNEQDMEQLWQNVKACLKELMEESRIPPEEIAGMAVSGQGEGLWLLDGDGVPVRNAILWNDGRANALTEKKKAEGDLYARIKRIVASYVKNGGTLVLLRWLKENEPESYDKAAVVFSCKDWIRWRLTGNIAWELSDASCTCMDLGSRQYAESAFELMGIPEAIGKMPPLISAADKAGELLEELAAETGLAAGTPVAGGMLDIVSAAAGMGAVAAGDVCAIVGTTGMTFRVTDKYVSDEKINGWELHVDGESYIKGMGSMAATPNLDWAVAHLFPDTAPSEVYARMEAELKDKAPFSSGLIYHPHISAAGERAPFFNAAATAGLLGVRQNTSAMDILHAVMEGVALSARDCLSSAGELTSVFLSGGGSKSEVWAQIYADVLNAEVCISSAGELSAKGAALSAGLMCGLIDSVDKVKEQFIMVKTVLKPNKEKARAYDELFSMYKQTQAAMEPFWAWRFEQGANK